jgi:glycosyltransferase involved in cell wall biosynthesis
MLLISRLNIGGPAVHAVALSTLFSEGRYRSLLVCGRVGVHEGDMSYLAASKGVKPAFVPALGRNISIGDDLESFAQVRHIIRKFNPHIIHTHTAKAGTVGRLGGWSLNLARGSRQRIKLVHTFHGHVFHDYFGPLKTMFFIQIERLLARFTDRIVVISPSQEEDICNTYRIASPSRVRVVPLGFDLSRYRAESKFQETENRGPYVVGIVGRLTHVKNHRLLLEAARDLKDHAGDQDFKFLVVGDGELRMQLVKYAKTLGVEQSFVFTGWKKDMPFIYGMMDAVVLTSLNEGTPVTLIEAMAAGKPVIATDVGGVRDLLGRAERPAHEGFNLAQHGILVPSGNRKILTEAILFSSQNRALMHQKGKKARDFVLQECSLERMTKELDGLYRELVEN